MVKYIIIFSIILTLVISAMIWLFVAPPKETGIALAKPVPEIAAIDIQGKPQTIAQLSGSEGLVLVFFRSADWCFFCKRHLVEIDQWSEKFQQIGYEVAAISYDSVDTLKAFSNEKNLKYPLLSDRQHKTMQTYNVLNQEYKPGSKKYGIPYPGIMVIDNKGNLAYKYFYEGYRKRVDIELLYNNLSQKNTAAPIASS